MNDHFESLEVSVLLEQFLIGTSGISDGKRITDLDRLPSAYRQFVREATTVNHAWVARQTTAGIMIARGFCDSRTSATATGYTLYIEWMHPDQVRHGSWWRCDPRRWREWTFGRGEA